MFFEMFAIFGIIAMFSLYCAGSITVRYYYKELCPFNKAEADMELFGAKDPKLEDGFDDDYDKKFLEEQKEYNE